MRTDRDKERNVTAYNDPHAISHKEQRVLDAIAAHSDLHEAARMAFPQMKNGPGTGGSGRGSGRDAAMDRALRGLEARRLVSLRWVDGKPEWSAAPLGPWVLSRAAANGIASRQRS